MSHRFLKRQFCGFFSREEGPSSGRASINHVFSKKEKVTKLKVISEALIVSFITADKIFYIY